MTNHYNITIIQKETGLVADFLFLCQHRFKSQSQNLNH